MKNTLFKRLISVILSAVLALSVLALVGCGETLAAPENVAVASDGTITWDAVENATEYVLNINSEEYTTSETSYKAPTNSDFRVTVKARADGYNDSAPSKAAVFVAVAVQKLATPENVAVANDGTITWSAVENATEYVLKINGEEYTTSATSYKFSSDADFRVTVSARAEGFEKSDSSQSVVFVATAVLPPEIIVDITLDGPTTVGGGYTAQFKSTVTVFGSDDRTVTWSVVKGENYATIDNKGLLTAKTVSSDSEVVVRVTSNANNKIYVEKRIEVLAPIELTQAMLDALKDDKISFEGYMDVQYYTMGLSSTLAQSTSFDIKTEMDGTTWHTEYESSITGGKEDLFYRNVGGIANMVSISYMNTEEYIPAQDEAGDIVTWEEGGMYNSFNSLNFSDFEFDTDTWEWTYKVKSESDPLMDRMISAANPYEFDPVSLSLMISGGEVIGIYAVSADDYTLMSQHRAVKTLSALITTGDAVTLPEIKTYKTEEFHADLQTAIDNTRAATNYTVIMRNTQYNLMYGGYSYDGYEERITADTAHFRPFLFATRRVGNDYVYEYTYSGTDYGYKKISDKLYNSYSMYVEGSGDDRKVSYEPSRAFAKEFSDARPSLAFAAEIFEYYIPSIDGDETMYTVYDEMSGVASTFYKSLGNDLSMYGIFATAGNVNGSLLLPRVYVKDGYITGAEFFYGIGEYMYGVIELEFKDYGTTVLPENVNVQIATPRQVPTSWNELTIREDPDDDVGFNALTYLRETLFEDNTVEIPFFGDVLDDSYGFGAAIPRAVPLTNGSTMYAPSVSFYYDVPLDANYTIESSLSKVRTLLRESGFTLNSRGHWVKGKIVIDVEDNELDLYIHVRKALDTEAV